MPFAGDRESRQLGIAKVGGWPLVQQALRAQEEGLVHGGAIDSES